MFSYIAWNIPYRRLGDDGMRDIILLVVVIAYMIGGYFLIGKIDDFFKENDKDFGYDENVDKKS